MKVRRTRGLIFGGYFLLGVALVYVFFLWRFPYEGVRRALIESCGSLPLRLSIGSVRPLFPDRLLIHDVRVQSASIQMQVPDLVMRLRFLALLRGKTDLLWWDSARVRRMEGEFLQQKQKSSVMLRLNHFTVLIASGKDASLPVQVSGELKFQYPAEFPEKGAGEAWLLLEGGGVRGDPHALPPLLSMFERVRADVRIEGPLLRVKRLEASGKGVPGFVQENIQLSGKDLLSFGLFPAMPSK